MLQTEDGYIIGIDAGTSAVKAVAFDTIGNEIGHCEIPLGLNQPHPLWVEQDMDQLWEAVKKCLTSVVTELKATGRQLAGLGITSTGDGSWMMDGDGRPVRPGILWCDGRAGEIVQRWHSQGIAEEAFAICGTAVFTGSQAAQLAWLRENEPDTLAKAAVIFHAKDWLFFKLTGLISSDETDESLTMLRMSTRQYDRKLFEIFQIADLFPKFPPVKPTRDNIGPILPALTAELGLPRDLMVGSGPMDVAACALGTGAIEHGQASSILGTAAIHQVIMDRPILKPKMVGMTLCHGVEERWIRMLASMAATPNLDWFSREFGEAMAAQTSPGDQDIYEHFESLVQTVPPGSEGVIYHPYIFPGGERGPFVKPTARASFTGLSLQHTARHLLRAVYEGVAFATLDCYCHMPIDPKTVYLSGGGANSDIWCQIMADCLGKPVSVPEGSQFGAKGAALNIGIAVGAYTNAQDAVSRSIKMSRFYEPNAENSELYRELYELYRRTAERQMDLWDLRANILYQGEQA